MGVQDRLPKYFCGATARIGARRLDRVGERALRVLRELGQRRVLRELGQRRGLERARPGPPRRAAGVGAFGERIDGYGCHSCEREEGQRRDHGQPPLAAARLLAVPLQLAAGPPGEHTVGEDVVEDLVPLAAPGSVDRADDALAAERVEHRPHVSLRDRRVLREVAGPMGDLRPGRRDEVAEDRGGDVLVRRL